MLYYNSEVVNPNSLRPYHTAFGMTFLHF